MIKSLRHIQLTSKFPFWHLFFYLYTFYIFCINMYNYWKSIKSWHRSPIQAPLSLFLIFFAQDKKTPVYTHTHTHTHTHKAILACCWCNRKEKASVGKTDAATCRQNSKQWTIPLVKHFLSSAMRETLSSLHVPEEYAVEKGMPRWYRERGFRDI